MEYIVNGQIVNIPTEEKCFAQGSEGKVYKLNNEIYKIYFDNMLNEGYGNKENYHAKLLSVPTKQLLLPKALIYNMDEKYVGYKTAFAEGNQNQKKKIGITQMLSQKFIKNLQVLENDFFLLTRSFTMAADVSPLNYIYNQSQQIMNVIDPGRYRGHKENFLISYEKQNETQLNYLIELLLYLDFIEYKPVGSKRKSQLLKERIKHSRKEEPYSSFFERELASFETVHDYAKSLEKYIK